MTAIKRISLLVGAATLTLTGGSFADTSADARNDELRARIAELEGRLANVEAQSSDNWLTEQRASEIRNLVEDVLADADTRSSMLSQGMTAGYDNGAVIASADGNWLLRTNLLLQTRFVFNRIEDSGSNLAPGTSLDSTRYGFEVSRARFMLSGNVVSPEWFYRVDIETSGNAMGAGTDTRLGILDAYSGYDFGNGWKVYGGQFKVPFLFEELVESQYQQAVDRSVVNYLYTGGYTQGLALDYLGDQFHLVVSVNNGFGGAVGVPVGQPALAPDTEIAFSGRFEWLAMGTWDQFKDITSPQGEEMGMRVGAAFHYEKSESDGAIPPMGLFNSEIFALTADVSVEFGGANVYAQINYVDVNFSGRPAPPPDAQPWGIVVGGGYYLTEDWEVFGRYEWSDQSTTTLRLPTDGSRAENLNILTVGVNKYFSGHNAKWTTDVGFALENVHVGGAAPGSSIAPATGFRNDIPDEDGQLVIRTQLQILF